MRQKRQRHTEEFKKEAARLMIMEGMGAPEVSKKLGVSIGMLYKWKHHFLGEIGLASKSDSELSPVQMAEELSRVRKELAREKRINEILKKTVSFFAKEES